MKLFIFSCQRKYKTDSSDTLKILENATNTLKYEAKNRKGADVIDLQQKRNSTVAILPW